VFLVIHVAHNSEDNNYDDYHSTENSNAAQALATMLSPRSTHGAVGACGWDMHLWLDAVERVLFVLRLGVLGWLLDG